MYLRCHRPCAQPLGVARHGDGCQLRVWNTAAAAAAASIVVALVSADFRLGRMFPRLID